MNEEFRLELNRSWFRKMSHEKILQAVEMYRNGATTTSLAKHFGTSRHSMWKLLSRRGLKMRSSHGKGADSVLYRGGGISDINIHHAVQRAVRNGEVERATICQECGITGHSKAGRYSLHAHHDDYNKILNVRWLCAICHRRWHKDNRAIPKTDVAA